MTPRSRILCIEDDAETLELLAEILDEEGYEPILARDGLEGVRRFEENPNLILCDVDMPGMSGFDVIRRLREAPPQIRSIPFLFITAYGSRDSHLQARRLGCDDFVTKPLDFELLLQIVRNRLSQQGPAAATDGIALTEREIEAMTWVARGKSSHDIAVLMDLSERTVNFHVNNVIQKMGVATRVQAAIRCALLGLIQA